jgi:ubiquinone biosynthesis protein UbiJ
VTGAGEPSGADSAGTAGSGFRLPRFDRNVFWPPLPLLFLVNRLIDSEPWAKDTLAPFVGKHATVIVKPFSMTIAIDQEMHLSRAVFERQADLVIEVPRADLATLALSPERAPSLVNVSGDTEFAEALAMLARHLRPDLEEQLAKVFGDVLAVRLTAGLNAFVRAVRDSHRRVAENLAEYLLEERPQLVRPGAVEDLSAAVRILRDDLARLEKRIERLSSSS